MPIEKCMWPLTKRWINNMKQACDTQLFLHFTFTITKYLSQYEYDTGTHIKTHQINLPCMC